ncbi:acyl-CoA dehydrogenase family protein [Hoyosella subflava]|uniref:Acyl-CoA dehydrogenase n=1 Tax=Hoyosella subflava (strain DSM 45089 / JCM 17490 / NBRC 109087 / DQS3-9A1) TaxID=443218 RepID=F6EN77_HOYSD|nr:acyl-CoA dehydrogenase family protein [Hoyosella subflava]AEF39394.1 Acyl-CoA dehydrogenase [Hoyosella subflava DQS3-9A1]
MDLNLDAATVAFRDEVRGWLRDNIGRAPVESYDTAAGFEQHRAWEQRLSDAQLSVVSWPAEFGGRDASLLQWVIFEEEYFAAGAPPRVSANGINMLGPTLFSHGTIEQRERILPRMASGAQIWAQAWSEPEAGSDIASLRSTATRADGGWLLNGQKTWSSRAAFAEAAFGLFRSDRDSERHKGLIYVMFDLHAAGVEVRPIPQLDGETGFAEIFLDNVFVPDRDVIGAPGDGWRVAMTTANNERGLSLRSPGRFLKAADRLVELWRDNADPADTALSHRVADAWIGARAYQLYTFGTVSRLEHGAELGPESSVNKLFWSALDIDLHETALDILGPAAELHTAWLDGFLFALAGPIYGGTDQIQRNVVAERLLGLPRG